MTRVQVLINSGSKVNVIHPNCAKQLGLPVRPIDVGTQKIDGTSLDTYRMVVAAFSVVDKVNWVRFFEKIFLIANVSLEVVIGMSFLTLSGANVDFLGWEFRWKTCTIKEALLTIRYIELVRKKEFAAATLDPKYETLVIHVTSLSSIPLNAKPQISGLITKEVSTKISTEYSDFVDIFSPDLASELSEYTDINDHAIE